MHIVYILQSVSNPEHIYVGYTESLAERLEEHNSKKSGYSKKYAPWEIVTHIVFTDKKKAKEFERYLKNGSGFAFLKKRLI